MRIFRPLLIILTACVSVSDGITVRLMKKFIKILFPGFITAFFVTIIFGTNAILDGYGDEKLFLRYFVVFIAVFIALSLALYFYARRRRIPLTLFNGFFLIFSVLVSFEVFTITTYFIEAIFECIIGDFLFFPVKLALILLTTLPVTYYIFTRLANWCSKEKMRRYLLAGLIFFLVVPWLWIYINENRYFSEASQATSDNPNILLLTVECLRYDYVGFNGNENIKTPNLDCIAKKGVVFDNYFVQAPFTIGSLPTLLTGLYPFHHGDAISSGGKSAHRIGIFADELVANGYFAKIDAQFVSELFPGRPGMFERQKESLLGFVYTALTKFQYHINDLLGSAFPSMFDEYCFNLHTSMMQTSKLLQYIRFNRNKKWFLWTHFVKNVHFPYDAPPNFIRMYTHDKSLKVSFSDQKYINYLNKNPQYMTDDILKGIRIAYSAEVSCADRQIGMIVNRLKQLNLLDKTIIIISADHGEFLGEKKLLQHGPCLTDVLIHVPLLIYHKNSLYLSGGKRIKDFVEEVDVGPTILDFCKVPVGQSFDGNSLLKLFESQDWDKSGIFSQADNLFCYRNSRYKLIGDFKDRHWELYDIINDPVEKENLSSKFPPLLKDMQKQLFDFTGTNRIDDFRFNKKASTDKRIKADMKALGYIQ